MKKISALLITLLCSLLITSCSIADIIWGDAVWDEDQKVNTVYYGVGYHIDDLDNTCVYIPSVGHVAMPSTEDGSRPNFKAGDLIKITFSGDEDIAILESYPAQFGARAEDVKVADANVGLEWSDEGFLITLDVPEDLSGVKEADVLVMKKLVTDGDTTLNKDFSRAEVKGVRDGRMTLSFDVSADEVLEALFESEYRFEK